MAANAGLGLRYMTGTRIWGTNAYYDYRNTNHQHYNQVSMGLESLGKIWDFRVNGYLPVGDKVSSLFGHAKFKEFKNHYMMLSSKREFAMKGANAEVGFHIDHFKHVPLYFAAGPYYLEGQGKATWGGELRAAIDIYEYVRLEGNTSYDSAFNWIGQGQISVNIPFGKKRKVRQGKSSSCSMAMALGDRALQRVDRMEIIPVDREHRKTKAINPATGKPYFFWFVNNTSHSAGTFESPFPTLLAAQNASKPNDVIYVFPGDGTSTGMDQGIILQNNQRLLSTSTTNTFATPLGTLVVPAMSSGMPSITQTNLPSPVITCVDNNEIAGIHVVIPDNPAVGEIGIACNNGTNASIHDNMIDGSAITDGSGTSGMLALTGCDGKIDVVNNTFQIGNAGLSGPLFGVHFFSSAPGASYLFNNNQFVSPVANGSAGIEFGVSGTPISSFNSIVITNNQFTGLGWNGSGNDFGHGIAGYGFAGTGKVTIDNNTFSQTGAYGGNSNGAIVFINVQSGGNITTAITNNTFENSLRPTKSTVYVKNIDSTSKNCVVLKNNVSDSTGLAYQLVNSIGGTFIADVSGNVGTVTETAVTPGTCP